MDKNHLVEEEGEGKSLNFIEQIIEEELAEGKNGGRVHTRFPPEPNGYLHIGHATSICLNFGLATEYQGKCNLRFDDTNPSKEDVEYIDSIQQDIQWLGFQWDGEPHFAVCGNDRKAGFPYADRRMPVVRRGYGIFVGWHWRNPGLDF